MREISRRAAIAGGLALATPAYASLTPALAAHPGLRAWTRPGASPAPLPLDVRVTAGGKELSLREWLDGRPAVLALWASWCGPCLIEKPNQAAMANRLARAGARTRILIVQSFDTVTLDAGRALLLRLHAGNLENTRALPDAEAAFIRLFGASPRMETRTSLPALLLIGGDGVELGRAIGTMTGPDGETDYWQDETSFQLLSRLS